MSKAEQLNEALDLAAKAQATQIKYWEAVQAARKAEQEILKQQIANAKSFAELQQMRWKMQSQWAMMLGTERELRNLRLSGGRLVEDVKRLSWVVTLRRSQIPQMWIAWNRISSGIPADWFIQDGRLQFLIKMQQQAPEIGSPDHLKLIELFGVAGEVMKGRLDAVALQMDLLQNKKLDIWKLA